MQDLMDCFLLAVLVCLVGKGTSHHGLDHGSEPLPLAYLGDMGECLDDKNIIRESGEEWFVAHTCESCSCIGTNISCNKVKRSCPEAPHPSCVEIPGGCCPTWDCSNQTCRSRKLGDIWSDYADPCRPFKCTEEGIRKTIGECPPLPPQPDFSCYLDRKGECCIHWECPICPHPDSFNQDCIQVKDQCQNNTECDYGDLCCLVEGCGKECVKVCAGADGTTYAVGQTWMDPRNPDGNLMCREDGAYKVPKHCNFDSQADDEADVDEVLHQESQRLLPDQLRLLNSLRDTFPIKDTGFYINNFDALDQTSTRVRGTVTRTRITAGFDIGIPSLSGTGQSGSSPGTDFAAVQSFVNRFDWRTIVPLLSSNIELETRGALDIGRISLDLRTTTNRLQSERNDPLTSDSPSFKHQVAFRRTDPISTQMANLGHVIDSATRDVVKSFALPRIATSGLRLLGESTECIKRFASFQRPDLAPGCDSKSPYRTLDGSCNNPTFNARLQGAAFTQFRRVLPPDYGDGVSTLRTSTTGQPLPSARLVSSKVNRKPNVDSKAFTILHMTFGQFLDHDLTATPIAKGYRGGFIKCCDDLRSNFDLAIRNLNSSKLALDRVKLIDPTLGVTKTVDTEAIEEFMNDLHETGDALFLTAQDVPVISPVWKNFQSDLPEAPLFDSPRPRNEECAPISIPAGDPFYSNHGQTCMEFLRSAPAAKCTFGPREQINQHSAYLDGSVIYGVQKKDTDSLRTFHDGLLKAQVTLKGQRLLPASLDRLDGCNVNERYENGQFCFKAGDGRVNEQILLTLFQTVWKREHNRVAKIFKDLFNPGWNDEKLFQETRRFVIAELQHVTYKELLPTVLGPFVMNLLNLNPLEGSEQSTDYDKGLDGSISNVFATAAYRFGHSEIADHILKINKFGSSSAEPLPTLFFHPFSLYERDTLSNLARGATSQSSTEVDPYFSEAIAGNLFKGSHPFGLDLVSLNLQRGRDHGIPGYTKWRSHCGLREVNSFQDLHSYMDSSVVNDLQSVYRSVHDIDLYIGGVAERPSFGGIVGPTFTCILADQFLRIKRGDQYWYEYKDSPGAFSKSQLATLHKVSLARIFCNNIPELKGIQPEPLKRFRSNNKILPCSSELIPTYSLNPWRIRHRDIKFPDPRP